MTAKALVPERDYQQMVVEMLDALGWAHCHTFPLRTKYGYKTGTTAAGWPDLVCLRGEWVVAIEVKSDTGRPTPDQAGWLERFAGLGCGRAWLVTPTLGAQTLAGWLQHPDRAPVRHGF